MPLLRAVINDLQLPYLEAGVATQIVTLDEVFDYLPFKNITPYNKHEFNREGLITANSDATASIILPSGTVTESPPSAAHQSDTVKVIFDSVYIPKMIVNDPSAFAVSVAAKIKAVQRKWAQQFIAGTGTDPQFSGIKTFTSGSATMDVALASDADGSGSLALSDLDLLYDTVRAGKPSFFVVDKATRRATLGLMRTSGIAPTFIQSENLGSGPVLTYNGIPMLVNEWIVAEGAWVPAYCIYANEMDGLTGFFNGGGLIEVSDPIEVTQGDMVEVKVSFRVGQSLMSTLAVARMHGIIN